jgi:hypothetical protein
MSLLRFIHHAPVGAPTYLDILPVDVIRHALIPFLGWEDRININRMTPPGDRTPPNKIPKNRIIAHQLNITIPRLTAMTRDINRHWGRRNMPRYQVVDDTIRILREFAKGHNMMAVQHLPRLRETLLRRAAELTDPRSIRAIPRIAQRMEMQDAVDNIRAGLEKYPAKHEVKPWKWLRERVTQNETSLVYAAEYDEGRRVFRRQGDIYTQWE